MLAQAKPTETFRAFAGWAARQLEAEMLLGAWEISRQIRLASLTTDPSTLWLDCLSCLQGPSVISN